MREMIGKKVETFSALCLIATIILNTMDNCWHLRDVVRRTLLERFKGLRKGDSHVQQNMIRQHPIGVRGIPMQL
jgi:hypothetical protein